MAGSMSCLLYHLVWSTKNRRPMIQEDLQDRLYGYVGGILTRKKGALLCAGGTRDHVHLLVSGPPKLDVSKMINAIKSNSSAWAHKTFPARADFAWQEGYGAFSVSSSQREKVEHYIRAQERHHRKRSFQEEFLAFLEKHGIEYDPRYVWK